MPVYLIRQGVTGPVKIGVANDVVKRLRQLQTNQPIALRLIRVLEGDRDAEVALHRRFHSLRLNGEWFAYAQEMADGDLGLTDLPIPLVKRNFGRGYPENAWGRERCLHDEILAIIGGPAALGRRMRLPPWEVVPGLINQRYWSATVLLLIDAGRHDITIDMLFAAQEARVEANRKIHEHNAKLDEQHKAQLTARREREWLEKNGPSAAWWPLPEPEEQEPVEQPETLSAPVEGAAA